MKSDLIAFLVVHIVSGLFIVVSFVHYLMLCDDIQNSHFVGAIVHL